MTAPHGSSKVPAWRRYGGLGLGVVFMLIIAFAVACSSGGSGSTNNAAGASSSSSPDQGDQSAASPSASGDDNPSAAASGDTSGSLPDGVIDLQQGNTAPSAPSINCPDTPSLADCFTEDTMDTYFQEVLPEVDQFFNQTWSSMPLPANVLYISDGASTQQACGDGTSTGDATADATSYDYCSSDDNVYIGAGEAWSLYSQAGDIAPATALAHEFGHDVQQQTGVPQPQTDAQTWVHEEQADCISGAWIRYAIQQGWVEQEDIPALEKYIPLIASPENDPNRTHGDTPERADAVQQGLTGGIAACNSYYPNNPIYVSSGQ